MTRIEFGDIGEVNIEELECYTNIYRRDIGDVFSGENGEISGGDDEVKLHFKDGTSKVTKDFSGILKLEKQVQICRD